MTTTQNALELGPIVGHTNHDTSRIWVRSKHVAGEHVVRFVKAAASVTFRGHGFGPVPTQVTFSEVPLKLKPQTGGYCTAQAVLEGLEEKTRYFYEVVSAAEKAAHPQSFVNDSPPSFRTLPKDASEELSFAFLSCNDVDGEPRRFGPMDMWERAVRTIVGGQTASFAIFGGDQVYADNIQQESKRLERRGGALSREELARRYGAEYLHSWDWPPIRTFMAHVPCLMMWDDHDIYDGYGSHGDENGKMQRALFGAASEAFDLHQGVHNVGTLSPGEGHRAFGFTLGGRAFLVLDGRSKRCMLGKSPVHTESGVLGDEQWKHLKAWLGAQQNVSHLVVVTGIPLVFLPPPSTAFSTFASVFGGDDDLRDQWSSSDNRIDQLRLLGTLFEFRKRTGATVLTVGGDVHAATVGTVHSNDQRYLLAGEKDAVLHQLVASGIARRAAPSLLYASVSNDEQRLSERMLAKFGPVHHSRNFALVKTVRSDKRVVTSLYLEGEDAPLKRHLV